MLATENPSGVKHGTPIVTVDVILLTLQDDTLKVCLHRRLAEPFKDCLALPGGYVHTEEDQTADSSALRVLKTKLGVVPPYLEQLRTIASIDRDPRGWSASIAYYALVPDTLIDPKQGQWCDVDALPCLAFDHVAIIGQAVSRLRNKSSYSSLPCRLLPNQFTISELKSVYEILRQAPINGASFRRKLKDLVFIEEVPDVARRGHRRPAQMYRLREDRLFDRRLG